MEVHRAGSRRVHFPDMVIWPPVDQAPTPLPVAVEVELTDKAKEELTENCRAWASSRDVEASCTTPRRGALRKNSSASSTNAKHRK